MKVWFVALHDIEKGELTDTENLFALLYNLQGSNLWLLSKLGEQTEKPFAQRTLSSQLRPLS